MNTVDTTTLIIDYPKVWGNVQNNDICITKIIVHRCYTRIEFEMKSNPNYYCSYGRVEIMGSIYIRPSDTSLVIPLKGANRIDFLPRTYFLDEHETYSYNMIFGALPPNTKVIDIVEDKGSPFGSHNKTLVSLHKEHSKLLHTFFKN